MLRIENWLVACFLVLGAVACGSGDGGVCQVNGDCQSGLVCCKLSTRLEDRGVCRPPGAVCAGSTDASSSDTGTSDATRDTAVVDARTDTMSIDAPSETSADAANSSDIAVSDSAATDANQGDASATDSALAD